MIRRAWAKISENEFLKNVTILFSGSTLAQAVPVLIAPIISRIYLPEHFGEQGLFVSTPNPPCSDSPVRNASSH